MHRAEATEESPANHGCTDKQSRSNEPLRQYTCAKAMLFLFGVLSCFFLLKACSLPYEELSLFGSIYKGAAPYTADRAIFLWDWAVPLLGLFLLCIATALSVAVQQARVVVVFALIIGSIDGCATFNLFNPPQTRGSFRIRRAIGSLESTRAALAVYAADAQGHTFPAAMASWGELTMLVNSNGAALKNTAAEQGFNLRGYTAIDKDGDAIFEDYTASFLVDGIPDTAMGRLVLVSPAGIAKKNILGQRPKERF